jgi:hypothetical protein
MPVLTGDPIVRRAWRYRTEPDRIHYIANGGSTDRHLYVDAGNPFYDVLDETLRARGYVGPSRPGRGAVPEVAEPVSA